MRIAIGCDHIVTDLKNEVRDILIERGHDVIDVGTYDFVRTHYPIYGQRVGDLVASNKVDMGISICGTGVGISNSTQKVKGTRVALVSDVITAVKAKEEYNANVIAFGGRVIGLGSAMDIVDNFMDAEYKGNNDSLIDEIDQLGNSEVSSFTTHLKKWDEGHYSD